MKINKRCIVCMQGFALISVISLIVLLALVAVALLSLSSLSLRNQSMDDGKELAQGNAKLGMMEALQAIQKSAGHDQRITAPADLVMGTAGNDDRRNWVGVWDSSTYNPNPNSFDNNKSNHFIGWLASFSNPGDEADADPTRVTLANPLTIFNGQVAKDNVQVDKIPIQDAKGNEEGSYAYWVQDHGLKASTTWATGNGITREEIQESRLAVTAGPDLSVYGGAGGEASPFANNMLEVNEVNLSKVMSPDDLFLLNNNATGSANQNWVRLHYHDLTTMSRGLLTDTARGGLQRDLSLAFEMDEGVDANAANLFNSQNGEFVAGNDMLEEGFSNTSASTLANNALQTPEMPVKARSPYRDMRSSGSPFSSDLAGAYSVKRGPTWWLLRDYANLYKHLNAGGSSLEARPYYPNSTSGSNSYDWGDQTHDSGASKVSWDLEADLLGSTGSFRNDKRKYFFPPAQGKYAPVQLGVSSIIGIKSISNELAFTLDQMVFLWNPYNCSITCPNSIVYRFNTGLAGVIDLEVKDAGNNVKVSGAFDLAANLSNSLNNAIRANRGRVAYVLQPNYTSGGSTSSGGAFTMAPGEVMVISPTGDPDGSAQIGYNLTTDGAIEFYPQASGERITLAPTDTVSFNYRYVSGSETVVGNETRFFATRGLNMLYLPEADVIDNGDEGQFGPQLEYTAFHTLSNSADSWSNDYFEYISPTAIDEDNYLKTVSGAQLASGIERFGILNTLRKPAGWDSSVAMDVKPIEVFSRFNPISGVNYRDHERVCNLNFMFHFISDPSATSLLNSYGINFSSNTNRNSFWGEAFTSIGTSNFPLYHIPRRRLLSIAELSHANISITSNEPARAIGNSWSSPFVDVDSVYSNIALKNGDTDDHSAHDLSWQMNDALFDRYFFSGFSGNTRTALNTEITEFFDGDHTDSNASPMLIPYNGSNTDTQIQNDLQVSTGNDDGYLRVGSYAVIDGAFNVNSTSILAWESLLRANRNLSIEEINGGDADVPHGETPFPSSTHPGGDEGDIWSGFSSLTDTQITNLATEIVNQVKRRGQANGPFMSLADFVNREMGEHQGVLQAAIDIVNLNSTVNSSIGNLDPAYTDQTIDFFAYSQNSGNDKASRHAATGVPGQINQAELLMPIAPRLRPRSDTFTIRSYGEAPDGATAYCEATVQRVPDYFDSSDTPWVEPHTNPLAYPKGKPESSTTLAPLNALMGRKYKIVAFRWLDDSEI